MSTLTEYDHDPFDPNNEGVENQGGERAPWSPALTERTEYERDLEGHLKAACSRERNLKTALDQVEDQVRQLHAARDLWKREYERWREDAWQCYVASGADPDGDDARHLNLGEAPREVEQLRRDYEEAMSDERLERLAREFEELRDDAWSEAMTRTEAEVWATLGYFACRLREEASASEGNQLDGAECHELFSALLGRDIIEEVHPQHPLRTGFDKLGWRQDENHPRFSVRASRLAEVERSRDEWRDAAFRWCHNREAERNLDGAEEHIKSLYADLAEVERERNRAEIIIEALKKQHESSSQNIAQRLRERDEARAEVERLRGALQEITELNPDPVSYEKGWDMAQKARRWARAALADK